jgi:hypothetical protein
MGKGTDYERGRQERREARQAAIARGEFPPNYHPRPELRLRADTPTVDIDERTSAQELLSHITPREYGVALRNSDGTVKAMVVPLDRYIELASGTVAGDHHVGVDFDTPVPSGTRPRLRAQPASLEALHVEQVDPQAEWWPGSHPRQHLGNPNRSPE